MRILHVMQIGHMIVLHYLEHQINIIHFCEWKTVFQIQVQLLTNLQSHMKKLNFCKINSPLASFLSV